jgi:hypothetical protein
MFRNFNQSCNYFAILDLSIEFAIEKEKLENNYNKKYLIFHQNGQDDKIAELNTAYQAISSPLNRAFHILTLNKIDFTSFPVDIKLLEIIYQTNEAIDKSAVQSDLTTLLIKNQEMRYCLISAMEKEYQNRGNASINFVKKAIELKYIEKILERIKIKLSALTG